MGDKSTKKEITLGRRLSSQSVNSGKGYFTSLLVSNIIDLTSLSPECLGILNTYERFLFTPSFTAY